MIKNFQRHFSRIAHQYSRLRTTDKSPIVFIKKILNNKKLEVAAEIGCGDGRYTVQLIRNVTRKCFMYCIDKNNAMLSILRKNLKARNIQQFELIQASAERLPFEPASLDCVFIFNALHHFKISQFLHEASRCLKHGGRLIIYTRLRDQNSRNIWGKYFPLFSKKETRLFTLQEFKSLINKVPELKIEHIEYFKFPRVESMNRLLEQAKGRHYSTFNLYTKEEFSKSINIFTERLLKRFKNSNYIRWQDENILFILLNGS